MKAYAYYRYGPPSRVLTLEERPVPTPGDGEVLIRTRAVGLNGSDWEITAGRPFYSRIFGLIRPKHSVLGSDIVGTVEKTGPGVSDFKPGDKVFGDIFEIFGGFAEYVVAPAAKLLPLPEGLDPATAAALPQSGTNALQPICDDAQLSPGDKVLILGACGGAGTLAIQLAKLEGAEVTAVDRGEKLDLATQLGADHVLDYRTGDVTQQNKRFDLILDYFACRSFLSYRRILAPDGQYMYFGGAISGLAALLTLGRLMSRSDGQRYRLEAVTQTLERQQRMAELVIQGKIHPVIDRAIPFEDLPKALDTMSRGEARGKIVMVFPET